MLADLAVTPFAEVIRQLSTERRSGDLEVRDTHAVKTVFFDRGRLIFAGSSLTEDRLGEALIALGRITDEEFRRASALMGQADRRRRFGEALVEAGVMDKDELGVSVARQVRHIVLSLFKLPAAVASFDDREPAIPLEYRVGLSIHRLLYVGIRAMTSQPLVLAGLGDLERTVTLAPVPPFRFAIHKCPSGELEILKQSRKPVVLKELASTKRGLSTPKLRAVYALCASGVLQDAGVSPEERAPQPVAHPETGTFLLSPLQRQADPPSGKIVKTEVERHLARTSKLDLDAWLAVASRDEVKKALEEQMERYSVLLDNVGGDTGLRKDIELILGRTTVVLRRLVDSPPEKQGGQQVAAAPAPRPAAPLSEPKQAPPPAKPASQPRKRARPGTEGQRLVASGPTTLPLGTRASVVQGRVSSLTSPRGGRPVASVTGVGPGAAVTQAPASKAPSVPAASAPRKAQAPASLVPETVAKKGDPETARLLKDAELRMTMKDFSGAAALFRRVVDREPTIAPHRVRLALAMMRWPASARQAEREFLEAVHLEPNSAEIHYLFGLYYKRMRLKNRALAELRTALFLDPRHSEAREEFEVLAPGDSILSGLKKLARRPRS